VGLPGKRPANTNENRNEESGKGSEYPFAKRRPVVRDLIIPKAGRARRLDRRFHRTSTNALIVYVVHIERFCERWALRVIHWVLRRQFAGRGPHGLTEARQERSSPGAIMRSSHAIVTIRAIKFPLVETN
jgi:hypothetical protein